tara:strand:- start:351 stop:614 length:264 start_codon:yes stop_codon:yes gene_type:complete
MDSLEEAMRKMIAYRFSEEWIERMKLLSESMRITKTSVLEYCVDYCMEPRKIDFITYAMARREGSEPEIGNSLSDGLRKSSAKSHAE